MIGISIPNFVMAPLLILLFSVFLSWLPAGGWEDGAIQNRILPIVSLALPQIAYLARLTRASMLQVIREDYIRTARAKGLSERVVIVRHGSDYAPPRPTRPVPALPLPRPPRLPR